MLPFALQTPAEQHPRPSEQMRAAWLFFGLCLTLFVLGGLYFGHVFLSNLRTLAYASSRPVPTAGQHQPVPAAPTPTGGPTATGQAPEPSDSLPTWEGQETLGILLLGVDRRPDEPVEKSRTDTMVLVVVSPETRTAALVSVPRDLWVPIPGQGSSGSTSLTAWAGRN